eukprot:scaffold5383_cov222-Amphora_coffeaeformis.AAC.9
MLRWWDGVEWKEYPAPQRASDEEEEEEYKGTRKILCIKTTKLRVQCMPNRVAIFDLVNLNRRTRSQLAPDMAAYNILMLEGKLEDTIELFHAIEEHKKKGASPPPKVPKRFNYPPPPF